LEGEFSEITMDQQEGMSSNRAPLFKVNAYAFWSIRMRIYLMALGCDVWIYLVNGYTAPSNTTAKKLYNDIQGLLMKLWVD
jgi:hypothetical protein